MGSAKTSEYRARSLFEAMTPATTGTDDQRGERVLGSPPPSGSTVCNAQHDHVAAYAVHDCAKAVASSPQVPSFALIVVEVRQIRSLPRRE